MGQRSSRCRSVADLLAAMLDTSHIDRWLYNAWSRADAAIRRRDLRAVLDALEVRRQHCFVWPETYEKVYHYQKLSAASGVARILAGELSDLPVVMRSAKTSLHAKYGKGGWIARVIARYISMYRLTKVDGPVHSVLRPLVARLEKRHWVSWTRIDPLEPYRGCVLVEGRVVPIGQERRHAIEKGIELIEKLDRLAA